MPKNVEQTVRELMAIILNIDARKIDSSTIKDCTPGWDSANHINLILALEEAFATSFDVTEFESMLSYPSIVRLVEAKI